MAYVYLNEQNSNTNLRDVEFLYVTQYVDNRVCVYTLDKLTSFVKNLGRMCVLTIVLYCMRKTDPWLYYFMKQCHIPIMNPILFIWEQHFFFTRRSWL